MSCVFPGFLVIETNRYTDFPCETFLFCIKNLLKESDGTYKGYRSKNIPVHKEVGHIGERMAKMSCCGSYMGHIDKTMTKKVLLKQPNGTYRRKGGKNVLL